MKYVAIGDIHGCLDSLKELLELLNREGYTGDDVMYIFLGDYVDRGPDSKGVIDHLIQFQNKETCAFLMGNHDEMFMEFLRGQYQHGYMLCGGKDTLNSYGLSEFGSTPYMIPAEHRIFFQSMYTKYETPHFFFCHAGIMPGIPFENQLRHDLMWIRNEFLYSVEDHGKVVVHGHTVESTVSPTTWFSRIGLDTGAVFGGHLTAGIFEDDKFVKHYSVKSYYSWEHHSAFANGGMGG